MTDMVALADIRFHADCQSRVSLDEETVAEYAHRMDEGAEFPPLVVFFDGSAYWLADGFHRYAAWKSVTRQSGTEDTACVPADIRQGTRMDAVRHALSANAMHGKRRDPGDYRKGYEIAVRCGLCEAHDTAAVRDLLACSERWARDLTAPARDAIERERTPRIAARVEAGESLRQIAASEGLSPEGVRKIAARAVNERQTAESGHRAPEPPRAPAAAPYTPPPPPARPPIAPGIARMMEPGVAEWSALMTRISETVQAIDAAYGFTCPAAMAPKAESLLTDLRDALSAIEKKVNHAHSH